MTFMPDTRPEALAQKRFRQAAKDFTDLDLAGVFNRIYDINLWGSAESRSGLGSEPAETATLRTAIANLLCRLGIRTLLDIPCGDFNWLSQADLSGIDYTGADIVVSLISANQAIYGSSGRRFRHLDLTHDPLPSVDVIFCRDCLVHLSFDNINRALGNMRASGSKLLLATTFVEIDRNTDIQNGDWRPLNFQLPPFSFPPPQEVIIEGCTECDGAYRDKALGLWPVGSLP